MPNLRSVRWGMIGAGSVTEVKSGPAFRLASRSALVAVMRRTPGRAADYARRHGKPAYIEKPMARNHRECGEINHAFEAAGLPLFVAYYRRKLPRFLAVKQMLEAGTLGLITSLEYRYARPPLELSGNLPWRLRAEHSGGGLFLDVGCHAVDLIDHLFGPIEIEAAAAINRSPIHDVEDGVTIRFTTGFGASGVGEWDFRGDAREDLLTVRGDRGRLRMSVFGDEPLRLTRKGGDEETSSHPNPDPIQLPLIQSIVDELCGDGASPSTGRSAARTSLLIDRILDAYYGGRDDAFWHRPSTWPGRTS